MIGEIIDLQAVRIERNTANGAREALFEVGELLRNANAPAELTAIWTDWLLAELWARGFKVVPVAPVDAA
jgi:hypothetical protein